MTSAPSPAKCRPSGRSSMPSMARTRAAVRAHQVWRSMTPTPPTAFRCTCVRAVQAVRLAVVDDLVSGLATLGWRLYSARAIPPRAPTACRARMLAWSEVSSQASYVGSRPEPLAVELTVQTGRTEDHEHAVVTVLLHPPATL